MKALVGFLLERIKEDAELAKLQGCDCEVEGLPTLHGYMCEVRMLAECQAKWLIVDECVPSLTAGGGYDDEAILARTILDQLAQIYADHPDYRPDWRS